MDDKIIALFIPSFAGGGAEKMMVRLANELTSRNYKVFILVNRNEGPYIELVNEKITTIQLHQNKVFSLIYLIKFLYSYKPKTLISALFNCNILSIVANVFYLKKAKVIITERNYMGQGNNTAQYKLFCIELIKKTLYRFADKAVGISNGITKLLRGKYGVKFNKSNTIHNPVFSPDIIPMSQEEVEDDWLLDPKVKVIISVGRLMPVKDYITLLQAYKNLNENINIKLMILGEGPERKRIENFIEKNKLSSSVKLKGFVTNPYKYIRHADLFALSSKSEGFGNVLVEALALGIPIVCTDCPTGPKDIIGNNKYGILVPVNSQDALSSAMKKILNKELVFVKETLQKRAEDFSVEVIVDSYEDLINDI